MQTSHFCLLYFAAQTSLTQELATVKSKLEDIQREKVTVRNYYHIILYCMGCVECSMFITASYMYCIKMGIGGGWHAHYLDNNVTLLLSTLTINKNTSISPC